MKIVGIVLLMISMLLLPVIPESFHPVKINTILSPNITPNSILKRQLVYAQNSTLDEDGNNTGTGISTSITNITPESDLPNNVGVHVSVPKSQQFQMLNIKHQQKQVPILWQDLYDILILGHQEYVTQQEYTNLKTFVENGGTLVLLDGNVLFAQVGYDRFTHCITLISGHGWTFNGKSAWRVFGERWGNETSKW